MATPKAAAPKADDDDGESEAFAAAPPPGDHRARAAVLQSDPKMRSLKGHIRDVRRENRSHSAGAIGPIGAGAAASESPASLRVGACKNMDRMMHTIAKSEVILPGSRVPKTYAMTPKPPEVDDYMRSVAADEVRRGNPVGAAARQDWRGSMDKNLKRLFIDFDLARSPELKSASPRKPAGGEAVELQMALQEVGGVWNEEFARPKAPVRKDLSNELVCNHLDKCHDYFQMSGFGAQGQKVIFAYSSGEHKAKPLKQELEVRRVTNKIAAWSAVSIKSHIGLELVARSHGAVVSMVREIADEDFPVRVEATGGPTVLSPANLRYKPDDPVRPGSLRVAPRTRGARGSKAPGEGGLSGSASSPALRRAGSQAIESPAAVD